MSKWNVAVLFLRVRVALILERSQSSDELGPRLRRFDDGVDVASFRRHIRIGETLAEIVGFFAAQLFAFAFGGAVDFALVDDIDRAFRTHHGNFSSGPGEINVRANMF